MHPILASLSYHILVVKNELDLYEMIRRALECDRFHDTFAAKKTTAILLLSSLKIDIVLVDVRLPTVSAPRWRNTGVVENTGHIDDRASPAHGGVRSDGRRISREAVPARAASSGSAEPAGKGPSGVTTAHAAAARRWE